MGDHELFLYAQKGKEEIELIKIKNRIMKKVGVCLLMAATILTSVNIPGLGAQNVYAQYASGTKTGLRATWTGGPNSITDGNGYPGENKWLLRYNTDSTSGSNFDYGFSEGGTISNVRYDGYVLRKAGVSLTAKLDFSNIEYMEFDLTRHSADKGDGVFFSAISDTMYTSYIQPASAGNSTASAATLKKKMKEETNTTIYKTDTKSVMETKTYDCASITGTHYFTIMNYSDGDGAAPLMQISAIRVYGPVTTYSDCHVTKATMTGTDTIDYGKTTTFTAAPAGGNYNPNHVKYQWYDNGNGSTHLMPGKTGSSITITGNENSAGHTYYCQVYADNDSAGVNTSGGWCSKKLNVNAPTFTANLPSTVNMGLNGSATLSISATNYGSVAWQKSTDNGSTWNDTGKTGTSFSITDSNGNQNGVKYRAVLSGGKQVTSNVCTVSVASPSFTTQPKSTTVNEGSNATFATGTSNTASVKWQVSKDSGNTWKDIDGATSATLAVENVTMDMSGYRYRAIATSGVGSTTSSVAILTVAEIKPQITKNPENLSVIEGRIISFCVNANHYKSVQWQVSRDKGSTWNDIEGATDPTYVQHEAKLTQDGERYRAVLKNSSLSATSAEAVLNVSKKSFIGFYVEYPSSEVDYKSTIKTSDVFTIFRYDNGDASFCKNAEGLTFSGGKTELYMGTLGEQTITCYLDGINAPQSFKVKVVDKSAPAIEEINIAWEDGEFTGANLSNDKAKKLVIEASVTDNSDGKISYSWSKDGKDLGSDSDKLIIDGNDGNGTYILQAKDETGNISRKHILVNAWDFTAPVINGFEMTPSTAWAAYRNIAVDASDDNALDAKAYSFDEGKSFLMGNSFLVDRNGTYKVIVRDMAGNTAEQMVEVTNIDRDAPEIASVKRFEEDGNVYVQIEAEDDMSQVSYGYRLPDGSVSWQESGKFLIEKDEGRDVSGRTFYAKDEAGNVSGSKVFINSEYIDYEGLSVSLNQTMYQTPSDSWTDSESGVKLGFVLSSMENIYDRYKWSNEDEDSESQSTQVHDNGKYSATVYSTDGNGNKDEVAATLDYAVENIDSTGPSIEAAPISGKLVIEAADNESGVDKVYVTGGGYTEETLVAVVSGNEDGICEAEAPLNGTYNIRAVDKVGNESTKQIVVDNAASVSENDIPGMVVISPAGDDSSVSSNETKDKKGFKYRGFFPGGYTNKDITIYIEVPEWLKAILADKPFSWDDGMTWTDTPYITISENGVYHLWIKLIDGRIIKCPDIVINCIDKDAPMLFAMSHGMEIYIYAKDEKCRMGDVILTDPEGRSVKVDGKIGDDNSFEADVKVTQCGTYVVTAFDEIGNMSKKEVDVMEDESGIKGGDGSDKPGTGIGEESGKDADSVSGNGIISDKYGNGTMLIKYAKDSYVYTGRQIRPKVKLRFSYINNRGKRKVKKLKENRDYTITYKDNIEAGTAIMTITGIGDFSGRGEKPFNIIKKSMDKVRIKKLKNIVFGTDPSKLHPTVVDSKRILQEGRDYTVSADSVESLSLLGFKYQKIRVTVSAAEGSSYTGSKSKTIRIYKRSLKNAVAVKISVSDVKSSDGVTSPKITVTYNGKVLKEGTDYNVVLRNNTRAGTGTAIITGHGNYGGKRTVKYNISR